MKNVSGLERKLATMWGMEKIRETIPKGLTFLLACACMTWGIN